MIICKSDIQRDNQCLGLVQQCILACIVAFFESSYYGVYAYSQSEFANDFSS